MLHSVWWMHVHAVIGPSIYSPHFQPLGTSVHPTPPSLPPYLLTYLPHHMTQTGSFTLIKSPCIYLVQLIRFLDNYFQVFNASTKLYCYDITRLFCSRNVQPLNTDTSGIRGQRERCLYFRGDRIGFLKN